MWKKSLGVIAMAGFVGAFALGSNGCSSSSDAVPGDGGSDGKVPLEGGDTDSGVACKPADVAAFAPKWQPPGVTQGVCSAAQIDAFVQACFVDAATPQTCDAFRRANVACDKCVVTSNAGAKLGVIIVPQTGLPTFNIAGCLAITAGDLSAGSCGAKEQAIEQCVEAACADNCPIPASPPATDQEVSAAIDAFNACEDTAAVGGCATFDSAAGACVPALVDAGAPSAACVVDRNDPNHDAILAKNLMQLFCGGAPADGGGDAATDGPTDAADGG